jgi:hypothetical protein
MLTSQYRITGYFAGLNFRDFRGLNNTVVTLMGKSLQTRYHVRSEVALQSDYISK